MECKRGRTKRKRSNEAAHKKWRTHNGTNNFSYFYQRLYYDCTTIVRMIGTVDFRITAAIGNFRAILNIANSPKLSRENALAEQTFS